MGLLKIYIRRGLVKEAAAQLSVLCGLARDGDHEREKQSVPSTTGPDWLFEVAAQVVSRFGLAAVQGNIVPVNKLPEACKGFCIDLRELLRATQVAGVDGSER